ncbi:MAG: hypothetical protein R3345_02250 [Fulvivirga sp.]|nr:hypothetical protein [Fulvivirga sp.]
MAPLHRFSLLLFTICTVLFSCNEHQSSSGKKDDSDQQVQVYPPAEGFNAAASDSTAIAIADSVMVAMGGYEAWNNLRYIKWNFFGIRDLIWDKQTGLVRIDAPRDSMVYLINVQGDTGKVAKKGQPYTHPDSVAKYVKRGKSIWINDSYWLVMPFKLKDTGVTLKYLDQDTTMQGTPAHVLELTFNEVGDTPENKYEVFVDKNDFLIKQWSYFRSYSQDSASAIWPWDNYQRYQGVLLSGNRSDNRGPKAIVVYDSLPDQVFNSFEKPAY